MLGGYFGSWAWLSEGTRAHLERFQNKSTHGIALITLSSHSGMSSRQLILTQGANYTQHIMASY